jgi:large subunit ribosomal protein L30
MMALKIKLKKSLIGRKDSHIATAHSLGLRKINAVVTQPDNEATRGKLNHISYLVEVTEE